MTVQEVADQFITQGVYLRGWTTGTCRTYRQGLATLHAHTATLPTKATLQSFVVAMRQRGLTPGGCNMYSRTINSYLTWLHAEGHVSERLRIKLLPNPPKPVTAFSDADIRRVLTFRPKRPTQLRTWTLVVVLLDTGLRIDEALGLERVNVDLDNLVLRVLGKGRKERLVPISLECRKHLYRLVTKQPSARYVFATHRGNRVRYRNAYRDIKALCKTAGVVGAHVHPHNLRHCFATNYVRRGGDIYRLSRILGHSTISTTQLYLRSMGVEHLREGHEQFSPLSPPNPRPAVEHVSDHFPVYPIPSSECGDLTNAPDVGCTDGPHIVGGQLRASVTFAASLPTFADLVCHVGRIIAEEKVSRVDASWRIAAVAHVVFTECIADHVLNDDTAYSSLPMIPLDTRIAVAIDRERPQHALVGVGPCVDAREVAIEPRAEGP
jgi:site-specific recombinase XerD